MTRPEDIILDQYAGLSHKAVIGDSRIYPGLFRLAPTWVNNRKHRRRLAAYKILAAYYGNVSRAFLNSQLPSVQAERREYGDAALLVDRLVAGVLGDSVQVVVDGADKPAPDDPELPEPPGPPPVDPDPVAARIHAERQRRWDAEASAAVDRWIATYNEWPVLTGRQDALRQWATDEGLVAKLVEGEQHAVLLGDSVLSVAWSTTAGRPVVTVYDPGFYFPVLTDDDQGFPSKVHLAWEVEHVDSAGAVTKLVRRLTFELVDLDDPDLPAWVDTTQRSYPWGDGPSSQVCLFTDASWPLDDLAGRTVDDFSEQGAIYATTEDGAVANRLDLGIDFVPVVHTPNTPATRTHWGESSLMQVAQLLDDMQDVDTDVRRAGRLASGPAVALSGTATAPGEFVVEPGAVFRLGPDGQMSVLDLSKGLSELRADRTEMLARLGENAKVPPEVLGRVRASEAVSGVALALAFGPFSQTVERMRLVRTAKYRLLLKMAQRMFQAAGVFDPGPDLPAHVAFGSYLPSDRKAVVDIVVALVQAKALSRQSGIAMLVDAGFQVDDAHREIDRIKGDDPDGALRVAEATASEQLAADWLGVVLPEKPVAPVLPGPPLPPQRPGPPSGARP